MHINMDRPILITGAAGFIGFHVANRLLSLGFSVVGYDSVNSYYDPLLKFGRLANLSRFSGFTHFRNDLNQALPLNQVISETQPEIVMHFAAQAGVRYSLENPDVYIHSNVVGLNNLLQALSKVDVKHFLFASTSSVYGSRTDPRAPFSETDSTASPISLYASTKSAGEALTHSWSHLNGIPTTVMRLFTVYGPWGRPDMALFKFLQAMRQGETIPVYGNGEATRDYTFVGDVVDAVLELAEVPPRATERSISGHTLSPSAPWRAVNVGGGSPHTVADLISALETSSGLTARQEHLPLHPSDMAHTLADPSRLKALIGHVPSTPLEEGVERFVRWYESYYG